MQDQKQPQELLESLRRLSDDELVANLKSLAARERRATALVVAHLAELDTRDLHCARAIRPCSTTAATHSPSPSTWRTTAWRQPGLPRDSRSFSTCSPRAR
jgi:hypothetical protein